MWRTPKRAHTAAASAAARSAEPSSVKRHVTPTTSYPARMSSAADTALSTPPLMPSATLREPSSATAIGLPFRHMPDSAFQGKYR